MKTLQLTLIILTWCCCSLSGQNSDAVRLFQNPDQDGVLSGSPLIEGSIGFFDFDGATVFSVRGQGFIPVGSDAEFYVSLNYLNVDPQFGSGSTGLSDPRISGRYLMLDEETRITLGGYVTLPVGSEEIGGGDLNLGVFGGLRHPLSGTVELTATAGLDFLEFGNNRETSLLIGGGVVLESSDALHFIGELTIESQGDVGLLSGGVDYQLNNRNRLRGALGVGLSSGSPDASLLASYQITLN